MLHILEADPTVGAEFDRARSIFDREIDHPKKTVLVARGDGPAVSRFVSDAENVADRRWRIVLWVKNTALFHDGEEEALFSGDRSVIAVLLDFDDNVSQEFRVGDSMIDVDDAFRAAERSA